MTHRSAKLDKYIGRKVKLIFKDGTIARGTLIYVESFSQRFGYKRPGFYYINDMAFRKTHIKAVIPLL